MVRHKALRHASLIIDRLVAYFNGDVELTTGQLSVAKLILNKLLPDIGVNKNEKALATEPSMPTKIERIIVEPKSSS